MVTLSCLNPSSTSSISRDFKNTSRALFFKIAHHHIVGNQFAVQLEGEKVEQPELYVAGKPGPRSIQTLRDPPPLGIQEN